MTAEIGGGILLGIILGVLEISWLSRILHRLTTRHVTISIYAALFGLLLKLVSLYGLCWGAFKLGLTKGLFAMIIAIALTMCLLPFNYLKKEE